MKATLLRWAGPLQRWAGILGPPLVLLLWIRVVLATGRQPAGDGPHVLGTAMRLAQQLRDGEIGTFAWCLQSLLGPHPPGAYLPATLAYLLGGTSWSGTHLLAGALVLWLCWDGIRRLGGGVVGALFLGATGLVWLQAEQYGVDLVGGACVVQALSHLAASERLTLRRPTLLWGAWMGAAFLCKYTAPMFLWAPCLVAGIWVLQGRRWRALLGAVGAFCLVAGIWYATHLAAIRGYLGASTDSANALLTNKSLLQGAWFDWENLSWYPAVLRDAFGNPGLLVLLLAALLPWRRAAAPQGAWILPLSGFAGGLLLLSTQIQRQDRYLGVGIPLLAALAGSSRGRWLLAPIGAIGLYGAAATYGTATSPPSTRDYGHGWASAGERWPWVADAFAPTSFDPDLWKLDEMLEAARALQGSDEGTVGFLLSDASGAPQFGNILSRVATQGYRWHVATVMVLPRGPDAAVFVGPFTTDAWPSRAFTVLLAIVERSDRARSSWLTRASLSLKQSWALPMGLEGRLYETVGGPLDLASGELPPDTMGGGVP